MPSTVVHAALGLLLAAGLLGRYYDRRALVIVVVIVGLPELDTLAGWYLDGAHRSLLHNVVLATAAGVGLAWETNREESWLRDRVGDRGVRIAWVGLVVHVFAHLGLDWAHLEGINLFYPLYDRFFRLEGSLYLSSVDGLVQTFVDLSADEVNVGQGGTTADTHIANPVQPTREPPPEPVDRRFPIVVRGWQLYLLVAAGFTLVARAIQSDPEVIEDV